MKLSRLAVGVNSACSKSTHARLSIMAVVFLVGLLVGCSSADKIRGPQDTGPLIQGEATEDNVRQALETKIAGQIDYLQKNQELFKNQVVSLPSADTTLYYKYYDEFPEPESINITITKTDSFSPSFIGEAKYRKIRYQTRYSRSRAKASNDNDFIRDQGVQKDIYEFDGERWRLKSSVFEVTKTSVYREDGWVVPQGRVNRVEEEKPEYFIDKVQTLFGLLD
ncbi:MAG: hypothetical protein Kow0099_16700 [Candidatus Abyssubacteria bacterium]